MFTKGPWKAVKKEYPMGYASWEIHWSEDGECIADIVYEEADAHLIAAAPAMFEALEYALACAEGRERDYAGKLEAKMRDALRLAREGR